MKAHSQLVGRLHDLVRTRNRELATDAALKAVLGVIFTLITFGVLWWMGWFLGWFIGRQLGLDPWQFGVLLSGVFFVVAVWSAWRRVDPMRGLKPTMTREDLVHDGLEWVETVKFSPRHAVAGAAVVLLGGPASVFEALGIWAHRFPVDVPLIDEAAQLLDSCRDDLPAREVSNLAAAFLLKRLALIKTVATGDSGVLKLTEKGRIVLR